MRKRVLTVKQKGKRIVIESQYARVGSVYDSPIKKTKKDENK